MFVEKTFKILRVSPSNYFKTLQKRLRHSDYRNGNGSKDNKASKKPIHRKSPAGVKIRKDFFKVSDFVNALNKEPSWHKIVDFQNNFKDAQLPSNRDTLDTCRDLNKLMKDLKEMSERDKCHHSSRLIIRDLNSSKQMFHTQTTQRKDTNDGHNKRLTLNLLTLDISGVKTTASTTSINVQPKHPFTPRHAPTNEQMFNDFFKSFTCNNDIATSAIEKLKVDETFNDIITIHTSEIFPSIRKHLSETSNSNSTPFLHTFDAKEKNLIENPTKLEESHEKTFESKPSEAKHDPKTSIELDVSMDNELKFFSPPEDIPANFSLQHQFASSPNPNKKPNHSIRKETKKNTSTLNEPPRKEIKIENVNFAKETKANNKTLSTVDGLINPTFEQLRSFNEKLMLKNPRISTGIDTSFNVSKQSDFVGLITIVHLDSQGNNQPDDIFKLHNVNNEFKKFNHSEHAENIANFIEQVNRNLIGDIMRTSSKYEQVEKNDRKREIWQENNALDTYKSVVHIDAILQEIPPTSTASHAIPIAQIPLISNSSNMTQQPPPLQVIPPFLALQLQRISQLPTQMKNVDSHQIGDTSKTITTPIQQNDLPPTKDSAVENASSTFQQPQKSRETAPSKEQAVEMKASKPESPTPSPPESQSSKPKLDIVTDLSYADVWQTINEPTKVDNSSVVQHSNPKFESLEAKPKREAPIFEATPIKSDASSKTNEKPPTFEVLPTEAQQKNPPNVEAVPEVALESSAKPKIETPTVQSDQHKTDSSMQVDEKIPTSKSTDDVLASAVEEANPPTISEVSKPKLESAQQSTTEVQTSQNKLEALPTTTAENAEVTKNELGLISLNPFTQSQSSGTSLQESNKTEPINENVGTLLNNKEILQSSSDQHSQNNSETKPTNTIQPKEDASPVSSASNEINLVAEKLQTIAKNQVSDSQQKENSSTEPTWLSPSNDTMQSSNQEPMKTIGDTSQVESKPIESAPIDQISKVDDVKNTVPEALPEVGAAQAPTEVPQFFSINENNKEPKPEEEPKRANSAHFFVEQSTSVQVDNGEYNTKKVHHAKPQFTFEVAATLCPETFQKQKLEEKPATPPHVQPFEIPEPAAGVKNKKKVLVQTTNIFPLFVEKELIDETLNSRHQEASLLKHKNVYSTKRGDKSRNKLNRDMKLFSIFRPYWKESLSKNDKLTNNADNNEALHRFQDMINDRLFKSSKADGSGLEMGPDFRDDAQNESSQMKEYHGPERKLTMRQKPSIFCKIKQYFYTSEDLKKQKW